MFLLITRLAAWLRLSRREEAWKTAEILILRHQLAVLRRRQPSRTIVDWGGPSTVRNPARRDTESAARGAAAAGYSRYHPALAPRHRPLPLGGAVHERQDRPTGDPPEHPGPGSPAGAGEPRMGIPQNPWRAGWPESKDRGVDHLGDPKDQRHRPRAATARADLVTVPAFSSRGDLACDFFNVDLLDGTLWGYQKSAWAVSCGDAPESVVGHDDQPCPSVCSTSSSSGSVAGWSCWAARRCRRTRSCLCCGTRSPCCAVPSPGLAWTGPTEPSWPR